MAGGVREAVRRHRGGIVALADLIEEHRAAFEFDWRARFGKSLRSIGRSVSWGEALRLAALLTKDTSSHIAAALTGWQYPAPREALVLMDLYDAFAQANFKRPKPYPRPWDAPPKHFGNASYTPDELRALLDEHRGVTSHKRDARGQMHDSAGRFVKQSGG